MVSKTSMIIFSVQKWVKCLKFTRDAFLLSIISWYNFLRYCAINSSVLWYNYGEAWEYSKYIGFIFILILLWSYHREKLTTKLTFFFNHQWLRILWNKVCREWYHFVRIHVLFFFKKKFWKIPGVGKQIA